MAAIIEINPSYKENKVFLVSVCVQSFYGSVHRHRELGMHSGQQVASSKATRVPAALAVY